MATIMAGCAESSPLGRAGVGLAPPSGWASAPVGTLVVPGTAVAAWTGPDGSSLVVLTALPIPRPARERAGDGARHPVRQPPGVVVVSAVEEAVAGLKAARVVVVGPGTGDALAPSGVGTPIARPGKSLIPTRRVILTIPRRADTLTLLWHYPESSREAIGPQVDDTIRSLKVSDDAASTSSY